MLLLLLSFIAVLTTAIVLNAVFPLKSRLGNWLAIACLVYAQIVLLSEVLSELHAIGRVGFIVGHGVLLALALALWWRRGCPDLRVAWWFGWQEIKQGILQHRLLALFTALVLVGSSINLMLAIALPSIEFDEMAYHVPRAYFWIQYGTAHPFPTENPRQNDFPPNPSFALMWMLLLSGGFTALNVPQWLGGLAAAVGAAGIAKLAGHSRAASLFAGLVLLTCPGVIMQMATKNNDALMGFTAASLIYFALTYIQKHAAGLPFARNYAIWYAGIAFGLMMGTKFTAAFLLPGAGIALAVYGLVVLRGQVVRVLLPAIVSAVLGFALFGSYVYVWNVIATGSPVGSQDIDDASFLTETSDRPRPELHSVGDNLLRYVYQVMNWSQFSPQDNFLFRQNRFLFQTVEHLFRLNLEAPQEFRYENTGWRELYFNSGGFGMIAYAALLISPLMILGWLVAARTASRWLVGGLLLVIVWGCLVSHSMLPWSSQQTRYFTIFMPLLMAAVIPWLYVRRQIAWVWLLPIMVLSLWTLHWTNSTALNRPGWVQALLDGRFSMARYFEMSESHFQFIRANVPPESEIALVGVSRYVGAVIQLLPEYHFVSLKGDQIAEFLKSGETHYAIWLSNRSPCTQGGHDYVPILDSRQMPCLFVNHPNEFMRKAAPSYGFDIVQAADDHVLYVYEPRYLSAVGGNSIKVSLPTVGLTNHVDTWSVIVRYRRGTIIRDSIAEASCSDHPVEAAGFAQMMIITLPGSAIDAARTVQRCEIILKEQAASASPLSEVLDIENVQVIPATTPLPPDSQTDLVFSGMFDMLGFALSDTDQNQVKQCSRLYVGSWWRARSAPDKDYHITLVLTDDTGVGRTRSDHLLSDTPPTQWQIGTTMIDRGFIPVPCDLPPDSYNLLVGVYDVDTVQNLEITLPDGAPMGTLAYLTTIKVQPAR